LNLVYTHANRLIVKHDLNAIFIAEHGLFFDPLDLSCGRESWYRCWSFICGPGLAGYLAFAFNREHDELDLHPPAGGPAI
jgi:hypothetical protein